MADNYCFIKDGVIKDGPRPVPNAWGNHSGLEHADDALLKTIGWLPFEEVSLTYDPKTHGRDGYIEDIQEDKVVFTDKLVAYTVQEIKQNTWNDWLTSMVMSDDSNHLNPNGISRTNEDIMDLIDEIDSTYIDKSKYIKLKEKRENKRILRASKPPQP